MDRAPPTPPLTGCARPSRRAGTRPPPFALEQDDAVEAVHRCGSSPSDRSRVPRTLLASLSARSRRPSVRPAVWVALSMLSDAPTRGSEEVAVEVQRRGPGRVLVGIE